MTNKSFLISFFKGKIWFIALFFFLLFLFIWRAERHKKRKREGRREREKYFPSAGLLPNTRIAGAGPDPSQELGTQADLSHRCQGSKCWSHPLLLPKVWSQGSARPKLGAGDSIWVPHRCQGPDYLSCPLLPPGCALPGSWNQEQSCALNPDSLIRAVGVPGSILTTEPKTHCHPPQPVFFCVSPSHNSNWKCIFSSAFSLCALITDSKYVPWEKASYEGYCLNSVVA